MEKTQHPDKLKKELGMLDIFAIVTGAMISSGIFVLPGLAFAESGPGVIVAYLLAGLLNIPTMFSAAELSTAMPRTGGTYFFIDRSMGPVMGTIGGICLWLSVVMKSTFALLGIGAFATIIFPDMTPFQLQLVAVGFCLFFMVLNFKGAKEAGSFQIVMVMGMLIIMALFIIEGFVRLNPSNFQPFIPHGRMSIPITAAMVYISFAGLTLVADVSEEVKDPGRNIPMGMFSAFIVVMTVYVLSVLVTVGVLPGKDLSGNLTPLVDAAAITMGNAGKIVLSLAAIMAFATTANAGIMAASRTPVSMSRDKHLPSFLARLHPRLKTPINSILITVAMMISFILFFDIATFVKIASTIMIMLFVLMNLAVIIMRESRLYNYRPLYRCPLYPFLPIVGIVANSALIFIEGTRPLVTSFIVILAGVIWYLIYSRIKVNRESAMSHVLERVMYDGYSRDRYREDLGSELKDIIHHRDEVVEDHFDKLVRKAHFWFPSGEMPRDEFLEKLADKTSVLWAIKKDSALKDLQNLEENAVSMFIPGVSVLVITDSQNRELEMLVVRSRRGFHLNPGQNPVGTVFVFLQAPGTKMDFLRSLVAIYNIFTDKSFERHWDKSTKASQLKRILLSVDRDRLEPLPLVSELQMGCDGKDPFCDLMSEDLNDIEDDDEEEELKKPEDTES